MVQRREDWCFWQRCQVKDGAAQFFARVLSPSFPFWPAGLAFGLFADLWCSSAREHKSILLIWYCSFFWYLLGMSISQLGYLSLSLSLSLRLLDLHLGI